jgi:hypothetical protein
MAPAWAPVFSTIMSIILTSRLSSTISLEMAWLAFSTVAKSSELAALLAERVVVCRSPAAAPTPRPRRLTSSSWALPRAPQCSYRSRALV